MKKHFIRRCVCLALSAMLAVGATGPAAAQTITENDKVGSVPLWFWNTDSMSGLDKDEIRQAILNAKNQSGYTGVAVLPAFADRQGFLTEEYFSFYDVVVETCRQEGMSVCLYDELWFPSGQAGGKIAQDYPQLLMERLDMETFEIDNGEAADQEIALLNGQNIFVGAVAMNMRTMERIDISASVTGSHITYTPPTEDLYKIMVFACVPRANGVINYLDPEATDKFIELVYEVYYQRYKDDFGTTIRSAFYDEPALNGGATAGRSWTHKYNDFYAETFDGENALLLYPALFMDIGEDTESARRKLLGFRSELFAQNFAGRVDTWCREHGIELTGHVLLEELVQPSSMIGDAMKAFQYQSIPGIDQIGTPDNAADVRTIISSAAYNYDKGYVMSESFGAMGDSVTSANLYKAAMEQYAKGINYIVPHAMWYDATPSKVTFPPELSYRNPVYGPFVTGFNQFKLNTERLLGAGRHVADIGILYPIASLNGSQQFLLLDENLYTGGVVPEEADYMQLGKMLSDQLRLGYTFLHPEVLDEKVSVADGTMHLDNAVNFEDYNVFILPGSTTISLSNLQKIYEFYQSGGKVIATTQLPYKAEEGADYDDDVQALIREMFDVPLLTCSAPEVLDENAQTAVQTERVTVDFGSKMRLNVLELTADNLGSYQILADGQTIYEGTEATVHLPETVVKELELVFSAPVTLAELDCKYGSKSLIHQGTVFTASGSFTHTDGTPVPDYTVEKAFDKDPNTRWNMRDDIVGDTWYLRPAWIEADFGNQYTFDEVTLQEPAGLNRVRTYVIEYWDSYAWKKLAQDDGIGSAEKRHTFDPVTGSKVRVTFYGNTGYTISECDVRYQGSSILQPAGAARQTTVTASSDCGGDYVAEKLMDGDYATRWNSALGNEGPHWIEIALDEMYTLDGIAIYGFLDRIHGYTVQYDDGGVWKTLVTGDTIIEDTPATQSFDPIETNKIRVLLDAEGDPSIYELELLYNGENILTRSTSVYQYSEKQNAAGGISYFIPEPTTPLLETVLKQAQPAYDVQLAPQVSPQGNGHLEYIHKVKDGADLYYVINSDTAPLTTNVQVRGEKKLLLYNPHTGDTTIANSVTEGGYTSAELTLAASQSAFLISPAAEPYTALAQDGNTLVSTVSSAVPREFLATTALYDADGKLLRLAVGTAENPPTLTLPENTADTTAKAFLWNRQMLLFGVPCELEL